MMVTANGIKLHIEQHGAGGGAGTGFPALLALEGGPSTLENRNRVWVRFIDVADGDLVGGGESMSLACLRSLIHQTH